MFTVCPKCALTLTVTAADLRVAQGFVRCGQCTNVFNALLGLSDERQQAAPATPPEEIASEPPAVADDASIEQTSLEYNPAAADVSDIFIEPEAIADDEV